MAKKIRKSDIKWRTMSTKDIHLPENETRKKFIDGVRLRNLTELPDGVIFKE